MMQEMADQEKQSLLEALEVKRQQREQESQAQERMLQQLKAGFPMVYTLQKRTA